MRFLEKVRNLPERERKTVFWLILIPFAILLLFLYGKYIQAKLKEVKIEKIEEEFQIQKLKEQLEKMPKIGIPNLFSK